MFSREELLEIVAKVGPDDLDHTMFIGRPADCAQRVAPWLRAAGVREIPLITGYNFATILFPEQLELGDNGLPRWHNLTVEYVQAVNALLGAG